MKYRVIFTLGLWMAMANPGWAQWLDFDLRRDIPWRIGDVKSSKTPTKIAAVWTDAVLHQAGKPATRGFGGRLMFYGPDGNTPIKVDGTLVVYAFDEEGRSPTDVKPDRKYVFPPEQFARHYSKSKLGHSYSVWIPWDEVGGPRKEISLITRFIPKNGGTAVVSAPSRQILPGLPTAEAPAYSAAQPAPSPSAHYAARPNPGQTGPTAWTPAGGQTPAERFSSAAESPEGRLQPGRAPTTGPSFPSTSRQTSFYQDDTPPQSSNPLRPTSYEESTPSEGDAAAQAPNTPNRPRMKTTTIPVPGPWLRPAGSTGSSSSCLPHRGAESWEDQQQTIEPGDSTQPQWTNFPTSGSRTAAGKHQPGYPTPSAAQGTNVTGFSPPPNQTLRSWPSQRPVTRSGPIGPQAPTASIAPQARDRAALPPLP